MVAMRRASPTRRKIRSSLLGRWAAGFSVLALSTGVLVLVPVGAASARTPPVDATGTVSCTGVVGSLRFVPPMRSTASSTGAVEVRVELSGCDGGDATNVTSSNFTGRIRGTISLPTNGCAPYLGPQGVGGSLDVTWSARAGAAKVLPSTVALARGAGTGAGGEAGLQFLDQAVTGSFSEAPLNGELDSNQSPVQAIADCSSKKGLKKLVVDGGILASDTAGSAPITCTGASQATTADPVVVTGCQPLGVTGGSGNLEGNVTDTVLTWQSGDSFQLGPGTATTVSPSSCPSGTVEVDERSTVTGASGSGTGPYVGAPVAYGACLTFSLTVVVVELVPGTSFTIG